MKQVTGQSRKVLKQMIKSGGIHAAEWSSHPRARQLDELAHAVFIKPDNFRNRITEKYDPDTMLVPTDEGRIYIEETSAQGRRDVREWITLGIAVLALLLSIFSVLEQAQVLSWLPNTTSLPPIP